MSSLAACPRPFRWEKLSLKSDVGSLAVTGHIGLRGNVVRISGVEGKLRAAKDKGCSTIIFPQGNKEEVEAAMKVIWGDSSSPSLVPAESSSSGGASSSTTTSSSSSTTAGLTGRPKVHFVSHVVDAMDILFDGKSAVVSSSSSRDHGTDFFCHPTYPRVQEEQGPPRSPSPLVITVIIIIIIVFFFFFFILLTTTTTTVILFPWCHIFMGT